MPPTTPVPSQRSEITDPGRHGPLVSPVNCLKSTTKLSLGMFYSAKNNSYCSLQILSIIVMFSVGSCSVSSDGPIITYKPGSFVVVNETIPSALFEISYFSNNNFLGTKVEGYEKPLCLLTEPASLALAKVQREVGTLGYTLKIFDCYRPQRAVDHFTRWVRDLGDQKMKSEYYPYEDKSQLIEKGYIADRSGHSRGSTVDLTLARKSDSTELDMGTPFDYFDTLSNTADPRVTEEQKNNRLFLKATMRKHGFINYDKEWWHYTLEDEPYPDTYFDFPVK